MFTLRSVVRAVPLTASLTLVVGLTGALAPAAIATPDDSTAARLLASAAAEASEITSAVTADDLPDWDDSWPAPVVTVTVIGRRATVSWAPVGNESHLVGYIVDQEEGDHYYEVAVGEQRAVSFDLVGGVTNHFAVVPVLRDGTLATPGFADLAVAALSPERPQRPQISSWLREHTVRWQAPNHDGGSPVTHYVVTIGEVERRVNAGGDLSVTVTAGVQIPHDAVLPVYIVAVNAVGRSIGVASSLATSKVVLPSAPRNVKVSSVLTNLQAHHTVTWDGPAVSGDLGVDQWEVTVGKWSTTVPGSERSATFSHLQGGITERVTVRAVNADGKGAAVNLSTSTPKVKPGKPRKVNLIDWSAHSPKLQVDWRHPTSIGTGPRLRYEVKVQRVVRGRGVGKVVTKKTTRMGQDVIKVKVVRAGTYRVKVRTLTNHGNSGWTGWKRVRVGS